MDPNLSTSTEPTDHPLFGRLSLEIKQKIMCSLPNIESLTSLVGAISSMRDAFRGAERLITTTVLESEAGSELLPEIIACYESSQHGKITPWTDNAMNDFISEHLNTRKAPSRRFDLEEAQAIVDLLYVVGEFAFDFLRHTLREFPRSAYIDKTHHVSRNGTRTEKLRVIRTYYRYEIYQNLFQPTRRPLMSEDRLLEQRRHFFSQFSPWENEQLACVHDRMVRLRNEAWHGFMIHDIEWGKACTIGASHSPARSPQFNSFTGLKHLQNLVFAGDYGLIRESVALGHHSLRFFGHSLRGDAKDENVNGVVLSKYNATQEARHIRPSFLKGTDDDAGPEYVWRMVHADVTCEGFVNGPRLRQRGWGYVMWDHARLANMRVLQQPALSGDFDNFATVDESLAPDDFEQVLEAWTASEPPNNNHNNDDSSSNSNTIHQQRLPEPDGYLVLQASWLIRADVFNAGGRGCWSFDDWSQILWTGRTTVNTQSDDAAMRSRCPYYYEARALIAARWPLYAADIAMAAHRRSVFTHTVILPAAMSQ